MPILAHDHPCAQDHPSASHGCPFILPLTARVPVLGALGIKGWDKEKGYDVILDTQGCVCQYWAHSHDHMTVTRT